MRYVTRLSPDNQKAFVMPTVIVLMAIMSLVAFAALLQASNGLTLAYKQAYIQMARIASKAAVDYAQEQFDNALCGAYSGTPEQELVSNDRYRVTFRADVMDTSPDGLEKTIRGTGSVYLPKLSTTAQYVFDIRSEIVRTYALCKSPDHFGPLVWLDASDTDTLKKTNSPTATASSTVGLGILDLFFPNDTVEEKVSDGTQGILSWLSNDLEMHTCDTNEYGSSNCRGNMASKDLYVGIVFRNVNVPQGATIASATLQLHGATPSGSGGSVTHRVYGLFEAANNPHLELFQPFGSNQVRNRITNSNLRTAAYHDQSSNNFPPGNTVNFDVTAIVQEMVNRADWDPADNDGRLGLGMMRVSGSGSRKACKGNTGFFGFNGCNGDGPELTVTYTTGTAVEQANNGEGVNEWQDKSGNGNHARSTYGNVPIRTDNQINGHTVVRFNDGAMLSSLTHALSGKREMTVFAVMKANFGTSDADGRVMSGMSSGGTNDTSGANAILPLLRYGSGNGFSSIYTGSSNTYRTNYTCSAACTDTPYIYVSAFTLETTDNTITATLKGNGSQAAQRTGFNPSGSPYTYGIDQFYFGGRRNGSLAGGSGTDFFNGDYAELVIYDKVLNCREIESLEDYFRAKWNISADQYETACPADTIPTL